MSQGCNEEVAGAERMYGCPKPHGDSHWEAKAVGQQTWQQLRGKTQQRGAGRRAGCEGTSANPWSKRTDGWMDG